MNRPKIVLDCDPGVDDAFAILTAARYCELLAITTVAGNVGLEHTTRNALVVTQLAGLHVPVHSGAARPLEGEQLDAANVHGETGLGGVTIPPVERDIASDDAVGALLELTNDNVTIVAIGPLTNIALAMEADPTWAKRIPRLVIMGGSTGAGNVTAAAEFNIWADPEAAAVVFESGVALTMAGLNLTQQVRMGAPEIETMRRSGSITAAFVADALEFYADYSRRNFGTPKTAMHDPCAVLEVVRPDLFERQAVHAVVETQGRHTRGMTLIDSRPQPTPPNVDALVRASSDDVVDLIVKAAIDPTAN